MIKRYELDTFYNHNKNERDAKTTEHPQGEYVRVGDLVTWLNCDIDRRKPRKWWDGYDMARADLKKALGVEDD